jgi:hypothetical protein
LASEALINLHRLINLIPNKIFNKYLVFFVPLLSDYIVDHRAMEGSTVQDQIKSFNLTIRELSYNNKYLTKSVIDFLGKLGG